MTLTVKKNILLLGDVFFSKKDMESFFDCIANEFKDYIEKEQPDTNYDLGSKLATFEVKPFNDVLIEFDVSMLNNTNFTQIFLQLPNILQESGEPDSDFILDIFKIKTKTLDNQVDTLVNSVCK